MTKISISAATASVLRCHEIPRPKVQLMNDQLADRTEMRRSKRVLLRVAIQVRWTPAGDSAITEDTTTLVVNAHGALISLAMKVIFVRTAPLWTTRNPRGSDSGKARGEKRGGPGVSCGPMQSSGGWNFRRTTGSNVISMPAARFKFRKYFSA
jgi:hypothetical protein